MSSKPTRERGPPKFFEAVPSAVAEKILRSQVVSPGPTPMVPSIPNPALDELIVRGQAICDLLFKTKYPSTAGPAEPTYIKTDLTGEEQEKKTIRSQLYKFFNGHHQEISNYLKNFEGSKTCEQILREIYLMLNPQDSDSDVELDEEPVEDTPGTDERWVLVWWNDGARQPGGTGKGSYYIGKIDITAECKPVLTSSGKVQVKFIDRSDPIRTIDLNLINYILPKIYRPKNTDVIKNTSTYNNPLDISSVYFSLLLKDYFKITISSAICKKYPNYTPIEINCIFNYNNTELINNYLEQFDKKIPCQNFFENLHYISRGCSNSCQSVNPTIPTSLPAGLSYWLQLKENTDIEKSKVYNDYITKRTQIGLFNLFTSEEIVICMPIDILVQILNDSKKPVGKNTVTSLATDTTIINKELDDVIKEYNKLKDIGARCVKIRIKKVAKTWTKGIDFRLIDGSYDLEFAFNKLDESIHDENENGLQLLADYCIGAINSIEQGLITQKKISTSINKKIKINQTVCESKYSTIPQCNYLNSSLNKAFAICDTIHDLGIRPTCKKQLCKSLGLEDLSIYETAPVIEEYIENECINSLCTSNIRLESLEQLNQKQGVPSDITQFDEFIENIDKENSFNDINVIRIHLGAPEKNETIDRETNTGIFSKTLTEQQQIINKILDAFYTPGKKIITNQCSLSPKLFGDRILLTFAEIYDIPKNFTTTDVITCSTLEYLVENEELHFFEKMRIIDTLFETERKNQHSKDSMAFSKLVVSGSPPAVPICNNAQKRLFTEKDEWPKDKIPEIYNNLTEKFYGRDKTIATTDDDKCKVIFDFKMAGDMLTIKSAAHFDAIFLTGDKIALYKALQCGCDCIYSSMSDNRSMILYKSCSTMKQNLLIEHITPQRIITITDYQIVKDLYILDAIKMDHMSRKLDKRCCNILVVLLSKFQCIIMDPTIIRKPYEFDSASKFINSYRILLDNLDTITELLNFDATLQFLENNVNDIYELFGKTTKHIVATHKELSPDSHPVVTDILSAMSLTELKPYIDLVTIHNEILGIATGGGKYKNKKRSNKQQKGGTENFDSTFKWFLQFYECLTNDPNNTSKTDYLSLFCNAILMRISKSIPVIQPEPATINTILERDIKPYLYAYEASYYGWTTNLERFSYIFVYSNQLKLLNSGYTLDEVLSPEVDFSTDEIFEDVPNDFEDMEETPTPPEVPSDTENMEEIPTELPILREFSKRTRESEDFNEVDLSVPQTPIRKPRYNGGKKELQKKQSTGGDGFCSIM